MKEKVKCSECNYKRLVRYNGNPNRYYCDHPDARFVRSECEPVPMICRTKRHSDELIIKTSPKWCPLNQKNKIEMEE